MNDSVVVPLPWDRPPLSQNDRDHRERGGARKIAAAKEQARWAIRSARLTPIVGAELTLHYRVPDRRRRDADNLGPALKVCSDALVAEGVLPDDSWVCVPASGCRIHPPDGPPAMWLELTNITHFDPDSTESGSSLSGET